MFTFTVDRQSPVPYYYQIEEWIRGLIASGQLKPGGKLPAEVKLGEQLGVSRLTVRRALENLMNDGLLIRRRAKGTFVAPPRRQIPFVRDSLRSMTEEAANEGRIIGARVLAQELMPAIGEIMRALQLSWNDQVVLVHRVRLTDDTPIAIEACYYSYDRFPELLTMDLTDRSLYEILEKKYNARPQEAVDSFVAGIATTEEARLLDIDKGAPVMHYTRVAMDKSGKPMEFARSVFRAEDYRFVIRVRRPNSEEE